jgi:hypothetical protein
MVASPDTIITAASTRKVTSLRLCAIIVVLGKWLLSDIDGVRPKVNPRLDRCSEGFQVWATEDALDTRSASTTVRIEQIYLR